MCRLRAHALTTVRSSLVVGSLVMGKSISALAANTIGPVIALPKKQCELEPFETLVVLLATTAGRGGHSALYWRVPRVNAHPTLI